MSCESPLFIFNIMICNISQIYSSSKTPSIWHKMEQHSKPFETEPGCTSASVSKNNVIVGNYTWGCSATSLRWAEEHSEQATAGGLFMAQSRLPLLLPRLIAGESKGPSLCGSDVTMGHQSRSSGFLRYKNDTSADLLFWMKKLSVKRTEWRRQMINKAFLKVIWGGDRVAS